MRKMIILTGLALGAGLGVADAQDNQQKVYASGRVITAPYFDAGHRLLFSQSDYIYGTARSAAMGGAFTSLGADLSSMSINPAGLGMYRSSDWGVTQAVSIDRMQTTAPLMRSGTLAAGGSRLSYGLNNVGAAYNVFNSSGTLTSLTLGFSYNRAANFNSRTTVNTFGEESSIAEMFASQLNLMSSQGVPSSALESSARPWENLDIRFDEWGAVLGYHTGLAGINDDGSFGYLLGTIPSDSYFKSTTKGGIYEYDFSMGVNLGNRLYLGATVGMTDIEFSENTTYEETYSGSGDIRNMWFDQNTQISGSGLTAKLGVVARPVEALRIGAAFHLPTWYTLEKSYQGYMGADSYSSDTGSPLMSELRLNTAPRLLTGISGIVSGRAIVAFDWEVAWYNKIGMRSDYASEVEEVKQESQDLYKPAHTFRAGFEYLLNDGVSLRAGGSYMGDFRRVKKVFDPAASDNPATRNGFSLTAGAGFKLGSNGYLDVAYIYNRARMTDYDFYYYSDGSNIAGQYDATGTAEQFRDRNYASTRNRHMITLTLGNRF